MPRISRLVYSAVIRRAFRYAVVGGTVNAGLFGLYLALTMWLHAAPLVATSAVYATGVLLTYLGNALWAFSRSRSHAYSIPRYVAVYLAGYCVQAGLLYGLACGADIPHQAAQLMAMVGAAGMIFLLLNFWVFRGRTQA